MYNQALGVLLRACVLGDGVVVERLHIIKRNAIPSVDTLEAICNGMGITLSQFFADGDLIEVTPKTRELIDCWSGLSEEQRDAALVLLKKMNQK